MIKQTDSTDRTGSLGWAWLVAAAAAAAILLGEGGCAANPRQTPHAKGSPSGAEAASHADHGQQHHTSSSGAKAYARRLAAAMGRGSVQGTVGGRPRVKWLKPGSPVPAGGVKPPSQSDGQPAQQTEKTAMKSTTSRENSDAAAATAPASSASVHPETKADAPLTRAQLRAKLLVRISSGQSPAMTKALDAATISVLGPTQADPSAPAGSSASDDAETSFPPRLLTPLAYAQRDTVRRYRQVLAVLLSELNQGAALDRATLDTRLDQLFGKQPISIRTVRLCRRVMGYGVYDPYKQTKFLAGSPHKIIIYTELNQFHPEKTKNGRYEVKLRQQIALFNESDGLAVWKRDPVQVVDRSRNRRHDFFVVQLITLPARLSVGKYRLKVRVTDEHGGSIDETAVPLQIVADASLVKNQ